MKQELSDDYIIDADNMVDFKEVPKGCEIFESEFYSPQKEADIKVKILRKDISTEEAKQVFQMKDGIFILEHSTFDDEFGEVIEYFYSQSLFDLI